MAGAAEHAYILYQRGEVGESDAWDDSVLIKAYDNAVSAMKVKLAEQNPEFAMAQPATKMKKKRNKSKSKKKKSGGTVKWKTGDICRAIYTEDGEIYEARILSLDEDAEICTVQYVGYGNEEDQPLSNLLPLVSEDSSQDVKTDTASDTGSLHQAPSVLEVNAGKHRSKKPSPSQHQNAHSKRRTPKWHWNSCAPPPLFTQVPPRHFPAFQPPHFPGCPPTSASHFPGYHPACPPAPAPHFPGYQAAGTNAPTPAMFPCVPPPPPLFTDQGEENEALYSMLISWYMSGYHTGYYQGLKHSTAGTFAASGHGANR